MTKLSGPIEGGTHGWAFSKSLRDPAELGYTEAEFFLAGEATRYALTHGSDYAFDGVWHAEERDPSPFCTRLLVRRSGAAEDATLRQRRDFGAQPPGLAMPGVENPNTLSFGPVADAALHHVQGWINGGPPPPSQARVEFAGEPSVIVRDEHENALGGIRLPDLAAPTGSHRGASKEGVPDLSGSSTPFSGEKLRELYRDHEGYLAQFEAAVRHGVSEGFLLPRAAERLRAEAAAAPIP